ncbi:MAG TPA: oxalurate catabolism protein HpxZ [Caldimonas sp.]|nr:oxalurate catabolism protein HpxZ [Caldimonas sp.]
MNIDQPDVHAEVSAAFADYEKALVGNDVETLDTMFWATPSTVRYGTAENLVGIDAIRRFRAQRSPAGLARALRNTVITTFGSDFATTMTEFVRPGFEHDGELARIGRQSQTWVRFAGAGWRVVAAHISVIALPPPDSTAPPMPSRPIT